ncbi:protein amalgam-like [Pollicipes pollicipes]|uniref:protein amalgam-like n=1 Tax=Pollicipes pollicipes TaxID=41117 RepID=UPI001884D983|nr:protein amalgam-like [Pollicipes pollicipes]
MSSISQSTDKRFKLESKGKHGSNLVINDVMARDSGNYECMITSNPPVSLKHSVQVQYAPVVTTRPEGGVLVVEEGQQVTLACEADGRPEPTVTWTKMEGLLPYGEKKHTGDHLDIAAVESDHMGHYVCTVDNGVGSPVEKHIHLEVNSQADLQQIAPQIAHRLNNEVVHTAPPPVTRPQLECSIHGRPMPEVEWYRVKRTALDEDHYQRYQEGHLYGIRIAEVRDSDLGVYSCQAVNELGKLAATVLLTGKPKPAIIRSKPNGNQRETYALRWSMESFAPLLEYKILYKRVSDKGESAWQEVVSAYPNRSDNSTMVVHKMTMMLPELQPASVYEVLVTARNKYGWSEQPDTTFRFSTLGANAKTANPKGGEALVSPKGTGAAEAPRAGVACLLMLLMPLRALW